jgi:hypothetical protein
MGAMVRGAASRPETGHSAHGVGAPAHYRSRMPALTGDQLELLQRARDGVPMWGGSVAIDRLRRDVDLLLALRLVEPAGTVPYRLTALGAAVLDSVSPRPS